MIQLFVLLKGQLVICVKVKYFGKHKIWRFECDWEFQLLYLANFPD